MSSSSTPRGGGTDQIDNSPGTDHATIATDTNGLTRDEIFEVLSNQRRRYAFHYLRQHEGDTVDVGKLAEQIASWELAKPPEQLTAAERKRVKTALHQFHLPKMDDLRFVKYDSDRGAVRLAEEVSDVEIYLDIVPRLDIPWGQYYLGLSGLNLLLLTGSLIDAPLISDVSFLLWAVFFLVVYGISAIFHTYWNRTQTRFGVDEQPPEVGRV
ncbi:DUF7344 domain-containing protein [Halalkalirubrum salinum]